MDATEIALEVEKQKDDPHFLERLPAVDRGVQGTSADSPELLEKFLPTPEDEARKADEIGRLINTSTRAGAGGTKVGLPGLRPSGGKAASEFIETFVGTGRFKPEPAAFSSNIQFGTKATIPVKKPRVVIYERCMECMERVSRDDCVPDMQMAPPPEADPELAARWKAVQVEPGEIVCKIICGTCARDANKIAKGEKKVPDFISPLTTIDVMGNEVTPIKQYMNWRIKKIQNHVFTYLKNECNNPESDVYYDVA